MGKIESVIFDWGGVLIDDPRPGLLKYCSEVFGVPLDDYTPVHDLFLDGFHTGRISEERFWQQIADKFEKPIPPAQPRWYEAFRSAYVPKQEMFQLVSSLHDKGYKTSLLSNTELPAVEFFHEWDYNMFDVLVFSCIEGVMKPERRIYEITLEKLNSKAGQAVFIDDREDYIRAAEGIGLHTIAFKGVDQVKDDLVRLGVK